MPTGLTHPPELLKNDWVYGVLRRRIRDLELPPGAPLRKDELSFEFGVSRAPISEAITRLADEGLVDVFPQHGSFVAEIRAQDVREGLFIRLGLETQAMRLLAISRTPELLAELDANIVAQAAALDAADLRRFQDLDEDMHNIIFSAVDFPRVQGFLDSARAQLDRIRPLTLPVKGRPLEALNEHRWMVEALRRRDAEFAAFAVRAHLSAVSEAVEVQLLRLLPSMSHK